ncbi:MAG: ribonuclease J [Anaerolineae bacterium]|jgi:ribonuclease J|nr:ribonuclease J [Anaerolineae bacterium]
MAEKNNNGNNSNNTPKPPKPPKNTAASGSTSAGSSTGGGQRRGGRGGGGGRRSGGSGGGGEGGKSPKLRIVPLGGMSEIGKNMTVFEMGNDAIVIDTGLMFPANDMLGVDYIIPDFSYLVHRVKEKRDLKLHAILYTHGHEDHTGAVTHVIDAFQGTPIYATPLTAGLLENKLREGRLTQHTQINVFNAGDQIKVGPFVVDSFHVNHSIPQCVGFGIHTPWGPVVHTGDYKFDHTPVDGRPADYARLAGFQKEGALLLMADSTNADRPGWTPSESVIDGAFDTVFRQAQGRIIVATFASLISRVQQVANAAMKHGRKLAIAGHSMTNNTRIARTLGILKVPDSLLIDLSRINQIPDNQVVIMATGAQGEPSAVLARIANGSHRQLEVEEGDTIVLSSHPIPGNEEMVYRTINQLMRRGANVIYDPILPVHVSGHGSQEEMRMMLNLVKPKFFMPVHGELRHLKAHAKLGVESGIPESNIIIGENGGVIEVDGRGIRQVDRVPGGYVFVDGSGVGDVGHAVLRDREALSREGFVVVVLNIDRSGNLKGEPEVVSRGFAYQADRTDLSRQIKTAVRETLSNGRLNGRRSDILNEALSRMFFTETRRRPVVMTVVNEV